MYSAVCQYVMLNPYIKKKKKSYYTFTKRVNVKCVLASYTYSLVTFIDTIR